MTKRNALLAGCLALIVAAVSVGGTLAYFWSQDSVTNRFTGSDGVDVVTEEPNWEDGDGDDLLPGDVVTKDPRAVNKGARAYVRMVVELVDKNQGVPPGTPVAEDERIKQIMSMVYYDSTPVTQSLSAAELGQLPRINTNDFTLDQQRSSGNKFVYTYNAVMEKGEWGQLFTGVVVPYDWGAAEIKAMGDFDMVIYSQAIQAAGFETAEQAFAALDKELQNNNP